MNANRQPFYQIQLDALHKARTIALAKSNIRADFQIPSSITGPVGSLELVRLYSTQCSGIDLDFSTHASFKFMVTCEYLSVARDTSAHLPSF